MESKEYYKKLFPLLLNFELIPNSESIEYNCISHTLNIDNDICWPYDENNYWPVKRELNKESFDSFYEYHGFEKIDFLDFSYDPKYIKVALYCKKGIPTHAAIQINENFWESKVGELGIIKHDLFEIENETYGEATQIYRKLKSVNERRILSFYDFKTNK